MLKAKVVGGVGLTRGSYHSSPSGGALLIASLCPRVLQVRVRVPKDAQSGLAESEYRLGQSVPAALYMVS